MSGLRVVEVCVDTLDPHRLAAFWAAALRWTVAGSSDDGVTVEPTDGTPLTLLCSPTRDRKWGRNRIHVDLTTASFDDQAGTVAELIGFGAVHVDVGQTSADDHVVLADPEGNEFCVLAPGNNFLAGCGRLGALNCDGLRATGVFWSAALGLPLDWDQDDETALRIPGPTGPMVTWSGPPLLPKVGKNRIHLDLAPPVGGDQLAEVERLVALGATRVDVGQGDVPWVVLADPDGNEFCVLTAR